MEKTKNLTTVNDAMKDKALSELANAVNAIYQATVVENKVSTLPEVVFTEYFLNFFMNQMNTPDRDLKYAKWIELSGSPYNEVTIIDNTGKKLYNVPPIYIKPILDESVINTNFSNIANTYMLKHNRLASEGSQYLNGELKKIANGMTVKNNEIIQRWIDIFKRYQNPGVVTPTGNIHDKIPTISNDDIEY